MKYVTVRQVTNGSRTPVKLPADIDVSKIQRVYLLLNEKLFNEVGPVHWKSVFIDDRMHDWDVRRGHLYYYAHSSSRGDVVDIILGLED